MNTRTASSAPTASCQTHLALSHTRTSGSRSDTCSSSGATYVRHLVHRSSPKLTCANAPQHVCAREAYERVVPVRGRALRAQRATVRCAVPHREHGPHCTRDVHARGSGPSRCDELTRTTRTSAACRASLALSDYTTTNLLVSLVPTVLLVHTYTFWCARHCSLTRVPDSCLCACVLVPTYSACLLTLLVSAYSACIHLFCLYLLIQLVSAYSTYIHLFRLYLLILLVSTYSACIHLFYLYLLIHFNID